MEHKALFLDRDGTINIDYGYVYQPEKFDFIDGIFELCKKAQDKGYLIIVITNQSGIARGYYTDNDFHILNKYMVDEFAKHNITITDVFYCPDLEGERRKPNCKMFIEAKEKYNIDMSLSISLGDKERDVEAGKKAGVGKNFLFNNSYAEIISAL
ncbi:MAG: HAD family hydrolase [Alphaproteobacteria bacterium]|nr:HAD family hydrolase [Alphaproteobacteria bacterium]